MKKFLNYQFLVRIGLALAFLANSLTAFFAPSEFIELIEKSFVGNLLPISTGLFMAIIGVNDLLVAVFLFSNKGVRRVAIWAALWIVGVMIVRGAPLDILEEAGFLFMAFALALDKPPSQKLST